MKITGSINKKIQQKVLNTIQANHLVESGDGVVVGVSGGPDSVCLLHVLHTLSSALGIRLYAMHVNHMLRAEEASADEAYTQELCGRLGIPVSVVRIQVDRLAKTLGMSIEEAGREARYREFERYAQSVGAAVIAVAHNRNDQAETVMMHIIRGTGIAGLVGMEYKRGAVIRPLLDLHRKDIEQYCEEAGLFPRTDSTNLMTDFTRNRVRLELFPYINEHFGADIEESLCRLSGHAAEDNGYIMHCAKEAYENCLKYKNGKGVGLDLEGLRQLHPSILGRVLKLAVSEIPGGGSNIGSVHYNALSGLIFGGRTGAQAQLPGGIRAAVSYGELKVWMSESQMPQKTEPFEIELEVPGSTTVRELDAIIRTSVDMAVFIDKHGKMGYNSFVQFFDYDLLKSGINIRNRRNGDIFKPFRSNGTKKLKEYFIDCKIPRELRDNIPLICIGHEVVWVVGYKISDKFKVTENTKSVLKIEYNRRASL